MSNKNQIIVKYLSFLGLLFFQIQVALSDALEVLHPFDGEAVAVGVGVGFVQSVFLEIHRVVILEVPETPPRFSGSLVDRFVIAVGCIGII